MSYQIVSLFKYDILFTIYYMKLFYSLFIFLDLGYCCFFLIFVLIFVNGLKLIKASWLMQTYHHLKKKETKTTTTKNLVYTLSSSILNCVVRYFIYLHTYY